MDDVQVFQSADEPALGFVVLLDLSTVPIGKTYDKLSFIVRILYGTRAFTASSASTDCDVEVNGAPVVGLKAVIAPGTFGLHTITFAGTNVATTPIAPGSIVRIVVATSSSNITDTSSGNLFYSPQRCAVVIPHTYTISS